jgi:P27 family predicted phage terminase small subunit
MGQRGPPPKPTKLRLLEGNPSKRPINAHEPQPVGAPVKPEFITGEAAREWDRTIRAMPDGFFTAADAPVLAVYCVSWVLFRNALAIVAQEGMTTPGPMGPDIAHPMLSVVAKQSETILRAADRLGMSPAARTRLTVGDLPEGGSKFAGLFGGHQLRLVSPPTGPKAKPRRTRPTSPPDGPPAA